MLIEEALSDAVVGAAIEVHRTLGPGLLETAYEECLCHELHLRGISFRRQVPVRISYKDVELDCRFRLDVLVDETIVVELKSVERLLPVHEAQLMTYLRLSGKNVGYLLNFNVRLMKQGMVRRVL